MNSFRWCFVKVWFFVMKIWICFCVFSSCDLRVFVHRRTLLHIFYTWTLSSLNFQKESLSTIFWFFMGSECQYFILFRTWHSTPISANWLFVPAIIQGSSWFYFRSRRGLAYVMFFIKKVFCKLAICKLFNYKLIPWFLYS